jgi:hypothetical protein
LTFWIYKVYTKYVDVLFLYEGDTFVWDGRKAVENYRKHGVRFETACQAFFDPASTAEDASVDEESRMAVIGRTIENGLLYIVHIEREGQWIRIISAREATAREERLYEDGE